jgi:hypothetical protein
MVDSEEKLKELYKNLVEFLSSLEFDPDVMFCGLFLNGDNSLLFASDGTYEFDNLLLSEVGVLPKDYIREAHCSKDKIMNNYPGVYKRIKQFLI